MARRPRAELGLRARVRLMLFGLALWAAVAAPVLAQNNPAAQAFVKDATAKIQSRNETLAILPLENAVKADPSWFLPRYELAKIRYNIRAYPEAIKQIETILQKPLAHPAAITGSLWTLLGKSYYGEESKKRDEKRSYDKAIDAFQHALALDKKNPEANYFMARICLEKGDLEKATAFIETALQTQDANPPYRIVRADIRYRKGNLDEAAAEVQAVLDSLDSEKSPTEHYAATDLQSRIETDLSGRKWRKMALYGVPIALVIVGLGLWLLARRGGQGEGFGYDSSDLGAEASSFEEISVSALRRLSTMTQMAHGVMYVTTIDGNEMAPKATLVLDPEEVRPMPVDTNELPRWIERNDGKPFLFKAEKKEGAFVKAFPETRELLEPLQIRIGVPFLFQERLLGVAFLGIEDSKDILKLKKLYEKSQGDIYRVAVEYAAALYRVHDGELAFLDVLTKLKSKRYVEENLPRALVAAEDSGRKGAVLMFEFDQFRGLQEQLGDAQAEIVLKSVAADVKLAVPSEDGILARFEGGKFFAYAPVKDMDEAQKLAERVRKRVCDTRIPRNLPSPTASVGIVLFPDHGKKADDLIWSADRVMMGVSASGGNAVATADGPAAPRTAAPPDTGPPPAGGFVPGGRSVTPAPTAPRPFLGAPPSAAPAPAANAPVAGFSAGPAPAAGATPFTPPKPPPFPSAPPKSESAAPAPGAPGSAIPGFSGGAPKPAPSAPAKSDGAPPKSGGIPGFSGFGGPPPPPPTIGTPLKSQGIPGFSGAGPAAAQGSGAASPPAASDSASPEDPPAQAAESSASPSSETPASKASSAGLTRKGAARGDTGGLKAKTLSAGAGKPTFTGAARAESKPLFPSEAPSGAAPPDAPPAAPPPRVEPPAGNSGAAGGPATAGFQNAPPPFSETSSPAAATAETATGEASNPIAAARSGLLGGKSATTGGRLLRRPGEMAPSGPSEAPSAAPEPLAIRASDRDASGFVNAEILTAALQREIERAQAPSGAAGAVLFLAFDQRAELSGRLDGDRLQAIESEIASLVNDFLKEGVDIPGRTRDGLTVVVPRADARIASNLAEQLRSTISHLSFPDTNGPITLSVGITVFPEHGTDSALLLDAAAAAARQIGQEGGNAIKVVGA